MIDGIFGVPPNLILVANQVHKEGGRGSLDDLMVDLNARSEYVIRIVTEVRIYAPALRARLFLTESAVSRYHTRTIRERRA